MSTRGGQVSSDWGAGKVLRQDPQVLTGLLGQVQGGDPICHVAQLSCVYVVFILILHSDCDPQPTYQPQGIAPGSIEFVGQGYELPPGDPQCVGQVHPRQRPLSQPWQMSGLNVGYPWDG